MEKIETSYIIKTTKDTYTGPINDNNLPHGVGVYIFHDHKKYDRYEGNFVNGIAKGNGKLIYKNGDIYNGEFDNNLPNGEGVYEFKNGDLCIGGFVNGKICGHGKILYKDGDLHIGEFVDGFPNGLGILQVKDGYKYVGEFKNDKITGIGIFYLNDGGVYTGELEDTEFNGYGKMTFPSGTIQQGLFKNHKFQTGISVKDGKEYYKANGAICDDKEYKISKPKRDAIDNAVANMKEVLETIDSKKHEYEALEQELKDLQEEIKMKEASKLKIEEIKKKEVVYSFVVTQSEKNLNSSFEEAKENSTKINDKSDKDLDPRFNMNSFSGSESDDDNKKDSGDLLNINSEKEKNYPNNSRLSDGHNTAKQDEKTAEQMEKERQEHDNKMTNIIDERS